jgi:hypothetical protein
MNTPTNPEESPQFVFFLVYFSDNVKFYSSPFGSANNSTNLAIFLPEFPIQLYARCAAQGVIFANVFQTIMFHDRVCLSSLIAPPGIHPRIPERCEHHPDVSYSVTISFLHSNLVVGSPAK